MRINDTKGAAMQFARQAIGAATFLAVLGVPSSRMTTRAQAPPPVFANFEEAQTNPLRLSADGTLLFAVNTPNVNRCTTTRPGWSTRFPIASVWSLRLLKNAC